MEIDGTKQALIRNCIMAEKEFGLGSSEYVKAMNEVYDYENKQYKDWEDKTKEKMLWYYIQNRDKISLTTLVTAKVNENLVKAGMELLKRVEELGGKTSDVSWIATYN